MCGLNSITQTNIKTPVSRNNTALHVCWHRGITISLEDHIKSSEVSWQYLIISTLLTLFISTESNFRLLVEKVQKFIGMAETLGGFDTILSLLLQKLSR